MHPVKDHLTAMNNWCSKNNNTPFEPFTPSKHRDRVYLIRLGKISRKECIKTRNEKYEIFPEGWEIMKPYKDFLFHIKVIFKIDNKTEQIKKFFEFSTIDENGDTEYHITAALLATGIKKIIGKRENETEVKKFNDGLRFVGLGVESNLTTLKLCDFFQKNPDLIADESGYTIETFNDILNHTKGINPKAAAHPTNLTNQPKKHKKITVLESTTTGKDEPDTDNAEFDMEMPSVAFNEFKKSDSTAPDLSSEQNIFDVPELSNTQTINGQEVKNSSLITTIFNYKKESSTNINRLSTDHSVNAKRLKRSI